MIYKKRLYKRCFFKWRCTKGEFWKLGFTKKGVVEIGLLCLCTCWPTRRKGPIYLQHLDLDNIPPGPVSKQFLTMHFTLQYFLRKSCNFIIVLHLYYTKRRNIISRFQLPSSNCVGMEAFQTFWKNIITKLVTLKAVCKTALD